MKQIGICLGRVARRKSRLFILLLASFSILLSVCCIDALALGENVIYSNEKSVRSAVTINRLNSTFSEFTSAYGSYFDHRMNCYGYALQLYYPDESGTGIYKQQPGEFANDQQSYSNLLSEYSYFKNNGSASEYATFVINKMYSDFATLNNSSGTEWTIATSSATESVPSGYRKIALAISFNSTKVDYHFYLRHSDGTWSHKQGSTPISNLSLTSHVTITDSNITTTAAEGSYYNGLYFFKIKKSAIVDYPHEYGHNNTTVYTSPAFKDKAGGLIAKSRTITGGSTNARLDYPRDVDFYVFTPSATTTYTFTTSLTGSGYNTDIRLYDTNGTLIASDISLSNASLTVSLTAGHRYFIRVNEVNQSVTNYTFYCQ